MRYIRWQGAIVFLIILGFLLAVSYLFAGPIAKKVIEKKGADFTGAEVNVEKVNVNFVPFGVEVFDLQATDPEKPMNNMISVGQASAQIDLWPLLFGKTIIDSLVVDHLAFGEKRTSEGKVYRLPEKDPTNSSSGPGSWLDDLQQDLPDPKTLLDNANLATVKQAKALEVTYQQEKENLEKYKQQLPDKAKLKEYEQRIKALAKVKIKSLEDLEKLKRDFDVLKKEFKQEQQQLKAMKEQVLLSKQRLSENITALKNAPQQDWQDISTKYQLETIEAEDFAQLIFGEKARDYYQWAEILLTHIRPLISNKDSESAKEANEVLGSSGRFVHFDERSPEPDFWLKQGKIGVSLAQATYHIELKDITHQHWRIARSSTVDIAADDKANIGSLAANASFSLDATQVLSADGLWSLADYPLSNIELQDTAKLQLSLVKALLGAAGKFSIDNGQLQLNSDFALSNNQFEGQAESKLANVLIDTLSSSDNLTLAINAAGDWLSPQWQLDSSLNSLLADAFKGQVANKLTKFKSELTSGLNEQAAASLSLGEGELSELLQLESLLNDTDAAFDNLAESDVVKQQQKKLENKAKDKLKEKLGKLFG